VTLWGSAFVAIRDAGETLAPGSLALGRLLVSLVVLGIAAPIWRAPLPERRDLLAIAGFGVLFLGVYSVTLNEAERRVDAGTAAMLINTGPILIAILAGVFLREGFPRWLFAGCAAGAVVCLPFAPGLVGDLDDAGAKAIGWMVYLGVAPTALGFAAWAYALRGMTAGRLASLAYLIPVVAILLGWALLGETPPGLAAVGGALCIAGVALARRR
jgi:drug/metabolite transporter (DMT)-like permease